MLIRARLAEQVEYYKDNPQVLNRLSPGPTGPEYLSGSTTNIVKHDDDGGEEDYGEGSLALNGQNFERVAHEHDILVVNFYVPWCFWSKTLEPSWEKVANIIRERHDPEADGRILLGKVDCTKQVDLRRKHHIQGYPSIRVFRKGTDLKDNHGHHEHESYYGDRDTESFVRVIRFGLKMLEAFSVRAGVLHS